MHVLCDHATSTVGIDPGIDIIQARAEAHSGYLEQHAGRKRPFVYGLLFDGSGAGHNKNIGDVSRSVKCAFSQVSSRRLVKAIMPAQAAANEIENGRLLYPRLSPVADSRSMKAVSRPKPERESAHKDKYPTKGDHLLSFTGIIALLAARAWSGPL